MEDRQGRARLRGAGILYLLVTILYLGGGRLINRLWPSGDTMLRTLFVQVVVLLVPTLIYLFLRKRPLPSFRAPLGKVFMTMLLAVLLMIALLAFNALWLALLSFCGWSLQSAATPIPTTTLELFQSLLTMALLPAVVEELLFRVALLHDTDPLSRRPYGRFKSVCFVGLAFALLHVDLQGLPGRFFLGVMLGLLYFWNRGKPGLSMSYHFANNAFVFLILVFFVGMGTGTDAVSPGAALSDQLSAQTQAQLDALFTSDPAVAAELETFMNQYIALLERIPMGLIFLVAGLSMLPIALGAALGAWCLIQRLRRDVPPWEDPLGDWGRGRLFKMLPGAVYSGLEPPPPLAASPLEASSEKARAAEEKPPSLFRRWSWLWPWLAAWALMGSYYIVGWL